LRFDPAAQLLDKVRQKKNMTESKIRQPLLLATLLAATLVGSVLLWNYAVAFNGDILGFYRIGTVLPHSPYVSPSAEVLVDGEVGYDGQLFLAIALDPSLAHPQSTAALDNPRYRYRRILFPILGYLLSFGQIHLVPFALVIINALCFVGLVAVVGKMFADSRQSVWSALFVLGIPGYWCALLLTTSDLLAALLLSLSVLSYMNRRFKLLAVFYCLGALTHETMLLVIGALAVTLLAGKQWKNTFTVVMGCVPALLWNAFVLWRIPSEGSTSGLLENFSLPGAGIVAKVQACLAGPLNAKWLFDSSAFALLCVTFVLLIVSLRSRRGSHPVLPCALAYLGFFILSEMQILSYYLDFLRVYGSALFLLIVLLQGSPWPRVTRATLLVWCVFSAALVSAYSMNLI
jgi:hypothetical protein